MRDHVFGRAGIGFLVAGLGSLALLFLGERFFPDEGPLAIAQLERTVAGELEIVEAPLMRGPEDGGRLVAVYFDPKKVTPRLILNDHAEDLRVVAPDALLVANAGFFTPERRATGLLVSSGQVLSPFVREGGSAGSGVFILEKGQATLVPRNKLPKGRTFQDTELAIQAGPRVIEPGGEPGIRADDGQRANRTILGRDARGRVAIVAVRGPSGWSTGPTLFEVQELLGPSGLGKRQKELALELALNLDGGPSTGLYVRAPGRTLALPESAPVYSVIALEAAR